MANCVNIPNVGDLVKQSTNVTVRGARGYWSCKQVDNISIVCSTECTVPSFSGEWNIKGNYKSCRFG